MLGPRRPASPFGCFPPASIRPRLLLPTITTWQALVANANCRTVVPLYPVYLSQALAVCLPFSRNKLSRINQVVDTLAVSCLAIKLFDPSIVIDCCHELWNFSQSMKLPNWV
ncbi:hypothetical protein V2G26_008993 [Clonostachys chloroleuca]